MTMVIIAKLHCIVDYIHNIQWFHFLFFMEKDRLKMTEFFQDVPDINRSGIAELSLVYVLLDTGKRSAFFCCCLFVSSAWMLDGLPAFICLSSNLIYSSAELTFK